MDQRGYLGLFRKFFDEHEFWKEKRKYSRAEAWIDLMQSARYGEEPETLFDKRGSYILEYADVYVSLRYLGARWQWSKNKVGHFLEYLRIRESILFKKRDSHRTIIHIINLKGYTEWIQGKRDSEGTVKGQSRDSEGTKKKKVKKDKKDKNINIYGEFQNVRLTDDEYKKLSDKYNGSCDGMIETMSQHIDSKKKDPYTGKTHYSAILKNDHWLDKSGGKKPNKDRFTRKEESNDIR